MKFNEISKEILEDIKYLNPTHKIVKEHKVVSILNKYNQLFIEKEGVIFFYPKDKTVLSSLTEDLRKEGLKAEPNINRLASLRKLTELTYHHFKLTNDFEASDNQDLIFNVLNQTTLNLVVEAVAGSGKTTTIVNAVEFLINVLRRFLKTRKNIAFFCFNKSIQEELSKRLPSNSIPFTDVSKHIVELSGLKYDVKDDDIFIYASYKDIKKEFNRVADETPKYSQTIRELRITSQVTAYTMHAYGLKCIRSSGIKVLINDKKIKPLLDDRINSWFNIYSPDCDSDGIQKYMDDVSDLVDLYRLYDGKTIEDVIMIADKYAIPECNEEMAERVLGIIQDMKNPTRKFKYGVARLTAVFEDYDFLKENFGVDASKKNFKQLGNYAKVLEYFELVKPILSEFVGTPTATAETVKGKIASSKYLNATLRSKLVDILDSVFQALDNYADIDYVDMLYVAATNQSVNMNFFDIAFVDEAQDLSRIQIAMLEKMRKNRPMRIIAVGDSKQAIYGFAGSDAECFQYLKDMVDTITLPLSESYRCSQAAVALAKEINSLIRAHSSAREGVVRQGLSSELDDTEDVAVLCRMNAPLIQFLYKLIALKKSAHIAGRNIADGLIKMVNRYKSIPDMFKKLERDSEKTLEKIIKKEKITYEEAKKSQSYINSIDKRLCIESICENAKCKNINDLILEINKIFFDEESGVKKKGIVLSSMHKSKGLEWMKVFILCPELNEMIAALCKREWQWQQEQNLKYVAYTRTKDWLIFISDFVYERFGSTKVEVNPNTDEVNPKKDDKYHISPSVHHVEEVQQNISVPSGPVVKPKKRYDF